MLEPERFVPELETFVPEFGALGGRKDIRSMGTSTYE
jgi:hypothetical protein